MYGESKGKAAKVKSKAQSKTVVSRTENAEEKGQVEDRSRDSKEELVRKPKENKIVKEKGVSSD